ncbi:MULTISPECIES: TerC family protein [Cryobacterium]|uniref:Tellurium resistance protein TerC n=1 Tax=Cryobacterium zongtaii TaxID=1259217 RepID=A0A2S3ZGX7_9MICO|nr:MULTISPECIES: TerC family protein [Cryobacterium]POH63595.1 tellurium resistance protein TerC [Cryobacterium zongtaii]POH66651.1 tellurium resistance protein TerC [Cryobacterium zongtaii]TFC42068.1 TerC family protein [Cryobacterium sp. TMN-39-2]
MNVPLWAWLSVFAVILVMLAIDLVAHRTAHVIGLREAAGWSIFWVVSGISFGVIIWLLFGSELGQQYFAGFLIEKSLAIDNVFVWAIIFASFGVPAKYQHRILFLGVLGALVFRGIFIAAGTTLIESFGWILYVFAALLVVTGIQMLRRRNEHADPTQSRIYRAFRRFVPTTDVFYGQRLLVRAGGALVATPLLAVLVLIEFTDIIFAIDSIPAIFAVTDEAFLVFTANAFAILGLRAMYFLLADLIHRFIYLKIGLAAILIWVGVKMALHDLVKVPTTVSLAVILVILATAVGASLIATRGQGRRAVEPTGAEMFRDATPDEVASLSPVIARRPR